VSPIIIQKDLIEKAKKKLGDDNEKLIVEALDIEDYDFTRRRCHCVFHDGDNTPSLIYDPKRYRMKCFGCGKSVDLIDAYLSKGDTFIDATRKLFKEAGVQYAFSEEGIKTKRDYRYPKHEEGDMGPVYEYMQLRCISPETVAKADVACDGKGNVCFEYFDLNNVLTMVKYKPMHKIDKSKHEVKSWCQKDADTTPLLWRMNRVNTNEPLYIFEGCPDTLAAIECGVLNSVSVPLGCNNFGWIETNFEFLEEFETIVICSDNDDPGIQMQKECVRRLGSWRTKFVDIPHTYTGQDGVTHNTKDVNEYLYWAGPEETFQLLIHPKDSPIDSVVDLVDVKPLPLDEMDGVTTGLAPLDKQLGKFYYGTLVTITGKPGAGKSSLMTQIICNAMDENVPCFLFSGEMGNTMTKDWFDTILAGPRNLNQYKSKYADYYYRVNTLAEEAINNFYGGKCMMYKDDQSTTMAALEDSMEAVVRKCGVKLIVLDNLMCLEPDRPADELVEQKELIKALVAFAKKWHVVIVLVAHPRKTQRGAKLELQDMAGTSVIGNMVHMSLSLQRISDDDRKKGSAVPEALWGNDVMISINKNRLNGHSNIDLGLNYHAPSRRFYTNYDEFDRQYNWDRIYDEETETYSSKYTDKIPYPQGDSGEWR